MTKSSQNEKDILKVIKNGISEVENSPSLQPTNYQLDDSIASSESLLRSIGYESKLAEVIVEPLQNEHRIITVRSFEELLLDANEKIPGDVNFSDILSQQEIAQNTAYIEQLNEEFNAVHRLDKVDVLIPAIAGILGGAVDCVFSGFVKAESGKNIPGTLSDNVQKLFDKALPPDKIKELEKLAKTTYDAQDNRNTTIYIDTLSTDFHRFLELGHDPILGFVFGVLDMLRGTMTTIDYKGKFVVQLMENYSDRKAANLFEAISTVFVHMLSDVNTPAGLPVPFMALFNTLQLGSIGEEKLNIAEMVKSMYGQGYDFRHFCSMSIPVMITEVIVRVSYFVKRLHEGHSFADSVPVGTNHTKKPKLGTMLFIAHSASTAINAGKVAFTENPLNINYAQWLAFARCSVKQLQWVLRDKPNLRHKCVMDILNEQWDVLYEGVDELWDNFTEGSTIVYI
ncbi:MAG: hypothetical protein LBQ21_04510 [Clostridiales Family XIII bacterium]|jgi:hypothetical protein|nr:hypothetical protein [Clostridiales Family XIII bacterium]